MSVPTFIFLLLVLSSVCLYVGSKSCTNIKNQSDYFLAGKSVGLYPLLMTFLATQVGGGLVLGASEEAYHYGWSVLFYPAGAAIGLIILGVGVGKKIADLNVSTIAQVFETRYRSSTLKKVASSLSMISLFMILVAQFIASSKFMVSLGVESRWLFIFFWATVIIYTSLGGFNAVVATDKIQTLYFTIAFFICFFWIYFTGQTIVPETQVMNESLFQSDHTKIFGWLLMPLFFMLIEQDMAQRCIAGKTAKVVAKATILSGIATFIICSIPVFLGVLAKKSGIIAPVGSSLLMQLISVKTNPFITAFVGSAIFAAVVSTADSLINSISSNLAQDFDFFSLKQNDVRASQWITAAIATAGIFFSFYFQNVVSVLIQSYELSVSCLFIPVLYALFNKKGNSTSAALSIAFGALGFVLFRIIDVGIFKELLSISLSLVGFTIGELIVRYKEDRLAPQMVATKD